MKACHLFFRGKYIINIPDLGIQRCYLFFGGMKCKQHIRIKN